MKRTGLVLLACLAIVSTQIGCQSLSRWWNPLSGYEPRGEPELDFDAARAVCEEQTEFRDFNGTTQVDWTAFEQCMKAYGWVRP